MTVLSLTDKSTDRPIFRTVPFPKIGIKIGVTSMVSICLNFSDRIIYKSYIIINRLVRPILISKLSTREH